MSDEVFDIGPLLQIDTFWTPAALLGLQDVRPKLTSVLISGQVFGAAAAAKKKKRRERER